MMIMSHAVTVLWVLVGSGFFRHCYLLVISDYNRPFDSPCILVVCYCSVITFVNPFLGSTTLCLQHVCSWRYVFTMTLLSNGDLYHISAVPAFKSCGFQTSCYNKMDPKEMGWEGVEWIYLSQFGVKWWILINLLVTCGFSKRRDIS